jgi:hypothetical protein
MGDRHRQQAELLRLPLFYENKETYTEVRNHFDWIVKDKKLLQYSLYSSNQSKEMLILHYYTEENQELT